MKRGYAGDFIPLLPAMLAGEAVDQGKGSAKPAKPHHTPVDPILSTSQPPLPSPPHPSPPHPSPPLPSPPHPLPPHQSPPFSPPHYSPSRSYEAPLPKGNTSRSAEDSMQLKELMDIVPKLVTRIETLETKLQQTKTTYGKAVLTLVKRVKILEKALKIKPQKVGISESEGEEPEDQVEDKQDTEMIPSYLVASSGVSKVKSTDKGKRYRRRARSVAKNINTRLDAKEEINTGRVEINTAKLEANAELTKDVLGKDVPEQDFAKRMVDMVNQRKKHFAKERAKAKRNKPMTHHSGIYMSNYLKNQGYLGRFLRGKVAEVKEEEPVKRIGKRKKQKAMKGINVDKNAQGDSETDKGESIMRANGADTIYMSFGAMIKDFIRDDLIELYRLVMQKYGTNRPEDAYDRVLWSDLRTMFDPPLNEDAI
ncbi:hypothetical protein Tco_0199338 [Tanacetum coccineum]